MPVLTDQDQRALLEALDDEYKAWTTYDQVITDFGQQRPFTHIRASEARHIEALAAVARHHGLEVPPNPWPGRVPRFTSLQQACEAGAQAERENRALHERLLASITCPELRAVLERLQEASEDRHLMAFERCTTRPHGQA
ncbi:MAG: DUF2202 domain-containing protein [Candidatus Sericytochromatia bacterium]|nr:DUF2202 domain-containing protein [Candidatus Sericytochromatia bacterium]